MTLPDIGCIRKKILRILVVVKFNFLYFYGVYAWKQLVITNFIFFLLVRLVGPSWSLNAFVDPWTCQRCKTVETLITVDVVLIAHAVGGVGRERSAVPQAPLRSRRSCMLFAGQ